MSIVGEFKAYALKGNVVDLAVGVVIGGAFGKIVTGVVNDFVMPVVGLATPSGDWRQAGWQIGEKAAEVAGGPPVPILIKWGDFLGVTLDFVVVAIVLFLVIKAANKVKPPAPPPAETKECPGCLEQVAKKAKRCKFCTTELESA